MTSSKEKNVSSPRSDFAGITRRGRAILIDYALTLLLFFFVALLFSQFSLPVFVKGGAAVFILVCLEPVMVSFTGGSIGHHLQGLRVEQKGSGKNLNIFLAFLRFFVKGFFGWLSMFLILTTRQYQALHDFISGSVVVIKQSVQAKGVIGYPEQVIEDSRFRYPPKAWRVFIILLYALIAFIGISFLRVFSEILICGPVARCLDPAVAFMMDLVATLGVLAACLGVVKYGWGGRLFGARRRGL